MTSPIVAILFVPFAFLLPKTDYSNNVPCALNVSDKDYSNNVPCAFN